MKTLPKPVKLKSLHPKSESAKSALPAPLNPAARIGYAIVGLGHIALEQVLPGFAQSNYARPVALVSGDRQKAVQVALQYGIPESAIYNYDTYDEIKDNAEIQAVYIALPNSMHAEFTIRAAKAGKHVLCEKPMATTVRDAERMIDACKKASVKLMIAYRIQYEPMNTLVKDWVRQEKYGKVRVIEAVNGQNQGGDPDQWRLNAKLAGGGALPDVGVYCLNTIRFLVGEEPDEVNALIQNTPGDDRFSEVDETMLWTMHFPGGTVANCLTSYSIHESRRYRCYGDKGGWFGLDPAFPYQGLKMEASVVHDDLETKIQPALPEKQHFALELDHFAKTCVIDGKEAYTPGEEGLQDQRILEALYKSAKTRRPVKLPSSGSIDTFRGTKPEKM